MDDHDDVGFVGFAYAAWVLCRGADGDASRRGAEADHEAGQGATGKCFPAPKRSRLAQGFARFSVEHVEPLDSQRNRLAFARASAALERGDEGRLIDGAVHVHV